MFLELLANVVGQLERDREIVIDHQATKPGHGVILLSARDTHPVPEVVGATEELA